MIYEMVPKPEFIGVMKTYMMHPMYSMKFPYDMLSYVMFLWDWWLALIYMDKPEFVISYAEFVEFIMKLVECDNLHDSKIGEQYESKPIRG